MSVRRLTVALAVLAAAVGLSASSVLGAGSRTQVTTVKVRAGVNNALKFVLSTKSAPAGKVKFVVTNVSSLPHDFKIAGKKTPLLSGKGKSATLIVTLKKGKYTYICTVPGHAAGGMKGTFTAK
jgi:plastocyanin